MAEEDKEKSPVRVTGLQDIPAPTKVPFEFMQNDGRYVVEFQPLTAEEVEAIRASIPEPQPPTKPVPGKGARDIKILKDQGYPTTFQDVNDPDYRAALRQREQDLGLEMVRVSLRWGPMPWDGSTPEALKEAREGFKVDIQKRMTAGNLANLMNAVTSRTFSLDQGLLNSFFANSALWTGTGGS